MNKVVLVFPDQLFENHPAIESYADATFVLAEDYLFFRQFHFHKQKLALHRASMKFYEAFLKSKKIKTVYLDSDKLTSRSELANNLKPLKVKELVVADFEDDWLSQDLRSAAGTLNCKLTILPSEMFLTSIEWATSYFAKSKRYFFANFYSEQRKRLKILVDGKTPVGGKWSFDHEDRKPLPKGHAFPKLWTPKENSLTQEAISYVQSYFPSNPGRLTSFIFPVTHEECKKWLNDFAEHRLEKFGAFEDSISTGEHFMYHSLLSPLMNAGLLTPETVVRKVLGTARKKNTPLNSLEGFIRQVIGWREYVRIMYRREGRVQRTRNSWGHTRKLPYSFWDGTTGIGPIDEVIQQVLQTGYTHHIQRLMVMGNFMFLCEFDPDDVYRWFMEMFVDAYDWVMVPNVYAMSQNADGGAMMTKPYISSSNYIRNMGRLPKGSWSEIWDSLYWRFASKNQLVLTQNARLPFLVGQLERIGKRALNAHHARAEKFLNSFA